MRRRIVIKLIDAYNFIIRTRSQITTIRGEAHGVYGTSMVAHGGQLLGLGVILICGIVNGVGGPYSDVAICRKSVSIFERVDERKVSFGGPPAAVASLVPSGET